MLLKIFAIKLEVGKAKKTIVAGLIGLVIIGIAWTIVSYVVNVTQEIA